MTKVELYFRKRLRILPQDTPQDVATKVQLLEHQWLPKVIEDVLSKTELAITAMAQKKAKILCCLVW